MPPAGCPLTNALPARHTPPSEQNGHHAVLHRRVSPAGKTIRPHGSFSPSPQPRSTAFPARSSSFRHGIRLHVSPFRSGIQGKFSPRRSEMAALFLRKATCGKATHSLRRASDKKRPQELPPAACMDEHEMPTLFRGYFSRTVASVTRLLNFPYPSFSISS